MNDITCKCGGALEFDLDESRKNGAAVYTCKQCEWMYILQAIGQKPRGWRTKKMLEEKEKIKQIPF